MVEGVSAYGSALTAAMTANVMAGGAAINAIANRLKVEITLVDVGIAGDLSFAPTKPHAAPWSAPGSARGPGTCASEAAMHPHEARAALDVGRRTASEAIDRGCALLAVGEIGIGNTTSAATLLCALTGAPQRTS